MAKKIVTLILAITLTLSVTACGDKDDTNTSAGGSEVQTQEELEGSAEDLESSAEESTEEEAEEDGNTDGTEANVGLAEGEDAFAAAQEKVKSVTCMEGQMIMEMGMDISADGDSQAFDIMTTMDMVCFSEPLKIKMVMNMSIPGLGSTEQSIYGETAEDGTTVAYMYDGTNWSKQVTDTASLEEYNASSSMLSFMDDGVDFTLVGMEEVDGANAYKYSQVMTGEAAKEAVLSSGGLDSLAGLGFSSGQMEGILDDLGEVVEYIWIDEATLYPVKYETDMTEVMNTMFSAMIENMGDEAEGMSVAITKMKMSMTCFNFNNATDFTIPEEAKQD